MDSITSLKCVLTQEHLDAICAKYFVPEEVHPQLPSSDATMPERLAGKVGMYTRFFDYANYRIPFSTFFVSVLIHFRISFSQLSVFGSAKVSHFEILCRVRDIEPDVSLFHYFYTHNYKNGWFGFTKRPNVRACYSKNLDSVKNWNDHFFWVDEFVVPANARFSWFSGSNIVKDRAPAPSKYMWGMLIPLLLKSCSLGSGRISLFGSWIKRNYLLNKDTYPRFEYENGEEMDLNAFIRTTDPLRPSGELSASIEREFVGDASVSGGEDEGIASVGGREIERTPAASHPPKRLRADYGTTSGSATGGKSPSVLNSCPLVEAENHTDSVDGSSLRTVGPSTSSSAAPVMTEATTVTTIATTVAIPADVGKDKSAPHLSVFCSSSSSEKTDDFSLFYRSLAEEKDCLLGAKDTEIEELKSQLLKAKEESVEVVQLRARVSSLEATEGSLRGEVASAKEHNGLIEQECGSLKLKVHGLETYSADLREKLEMYEGSLKRLEEFQDNLMRPLKTRLTEIDADFTRCCIRFQESFHPHLLNIVAGRRWLLTHGMKLLMDKCLNSTEYMEALGHAFGRAIEKGMQEGLAAGIEHGQANRCLTDLEAYIPSAEVDFNSAVRDLRDLDFLLLQELSNKKDASTLDVMDLLRLDDAVAEALGKTNRQPDMSQLMVPVHHKQDRVVRISQKSQENSQKQASTDTRIRRVQKEAKKLKPKPEKSSLQSTPVSHGQQKSTRVKLAIPESY
ncbi:hypothetical protein Tco_1266917 [Tanacetum coccineum]